MVIDSPSFFNNAMMFFLILFCKGPLPLSISVASPSSLYSLHFISQLRSIVYQEDSVQKSTSSQISAPSNFPLLIQIIDHLLSYCVDGIILNLIDLFKRFFWNRCFKFSNVKFDKFNLKFTGEIFKPITYYCCVVPLINFSFARYIFNCFFHIIFANVTNFAFGVIDQSAFSVVSEVVLMIMSSIQ